MVEKHEKMLSELEFKMRQMMFLCDALKHENQKIKLQLNTKTQVMTTLQEEFEQLNLKYNSLKFAHSLSSGDNPEDISEAKKKLSKLVQDVDKCIALLKK